VEDHVAQVGGRNRMLSECFQAGTIPVSTTTGNLGDADSPSFEQVAAQATRQERLAWADEVIRNNNGLQHLYEKVAILHRKYLQLMKDTDPRIRPPSRTE
jgi:hypothetical protein